MTSRAWLVNVMWTVLLATVVGGCAGGALQNARILAEQDRWDDAVLAYTQAIARDSSRAGLYFERGFVNYRRSDFETAFADFQKARALKPGSADYQLYFALAADTLRMTDSALDGYAEFLRHERRGELAEKAAARQFALTQEKLQAEIAAAVSREDTLEAPQDQNVIAVLSPDASSLPERYRPLALALADFAATDLEQVQALTVVERRRIDAVERELQLAETGLTDAASAPRTGRLLGAGTLLGGRLDLLADSTLRFDGIAFDPGGRRTSVPLSDHLHNFLQIEKQLVFAVVDTLGITLSREERDAIGKPPTESFLALLAYARGLDAEQRGDWQAAKQSYREASGMDSHFGAARAREQQSDQQLQAAASSGNIAQSTMDQHLRALRRQPMLRRLSGFALPAWNLDRPYTTPEEITRKVLIEIHQPSLREAE
jgi:tetratricopeptide (TPR) repeat protein